METTKKEWAKIPEIADELGVPRTRAYELFASGTLPGAVRIGEKSIRVNRRELEEFLLRERRTGPQKSDTGEGVDMS